MSWLGREVGQVGLCRGRHGKAMVGKKCMWPAACLPACLQPSLPTARPWHLPQCTSPAARQRTTPLCGRASPSRVSRRTRSRLERSWGEQRENGWVLAGCRAQRTGECGLQLPCCSWQGMVSRLCHAPLLASARPSPSCTSPSCTGFLAACLPAHMQVRHPLRPGARQVERC